LGKARALIRWKVGRAVSTALVSSSLPAWERKFEEHASHISSLGEEILPLLAWLGQEGAQDR